MFSQNVITCFCLSYKHNTVVFKKYVWSVSFHCQLRKRSSIINIGFDKITQLLPNAIFNKS